MSHSPARLAPSRRLSLGAPQTWYADPDELATEIAHEHHERIEAAREAAEDAQAHAEAAETAAVAAASIVPPHEHPEYAHVSHSHAEYVTRGELESLRSELSSVRDEVAEIPDEVAETGSEGVAEVPVPEPDEVEYEYRRTHGRMRRQVKG